MRKFISSLILVGIIFILAGCGSTASTAPTKVSADTRSSSAKTEVKQTTFQIGDTFKLGDLQYKVNNVRTTTGSNEFMKPKDGNTFLLIDMTIENQGNQEASISSMLSFKLVDKDGRSQDLGLGAMTEAKGKLDGAITPGRKMTGELGYEILLAAQEFELEIKTDLFDNSTAIVKIPVK
jgi:hypothetical protein